MNKTTTATLSGEARFSVEHGDCAELTKGLPADCCDSVVVDPPYGLGPREPTVDEIVAYLKGEAALDTGGDFMGEDWELPPVAVWREALRVLKPGGLLLSFGGTRTWDLISLGLRAAGFERRDSIADLLPLAWVHGQGWPKNGEAQLKPAFEPILLCRKPFPGTLEQNIAKHGTGALSIDECRIATDWSERSDAWKRSGHSAKPDAAKIGGAPPGNGITCHEKGRWPANVVIEHAPGCELVGRKRVKASNAPGRSSSGEGERGIGFTDLPGKPARMPFYTDPNDYGIEEVDDWRCAPGCPAAELDRQSGVLKSHGGHVTAEMASMGYGGGTGSAREVHSDAGGASRFFYCAKASDAERNENLDEDNDFKAVKPLKLMRYLVRLVTPKAGLVLDLYTGSGSTGVAALMEGRRFLGFERELATVKLARKRIENALGPLFASALGGSQ